MAEAQRIRRSYVAATFVEVIPGGVFRYRLQNVCGKDIKSFQGAFNLYDAHGERLGGKSLTFTTKEGWLKSGATYNGDASVDSMTTSPTDGASLLGKLRRGPEKISFVVEADAIEFMNGTKEPALEALK